MQGLINDYNRGDQIAVDTTLAMYQTTIQTQNEDFVDSVKNMEG